MLPEHGALASSLGAMLRMHQTISAMQFRAGLEENTLLLATTFAIPARPSAGVKRRLKGMEEIETANADLIPLAPAPAMLVTGVLALVDVTPHKITAGISAEGVPPPHGVLNR
jgi:hypothetical protein